MGKKPVKPPPRVKPNSAPATRSDAPESSRGRSGGKAETLPRPPAAADRSVRAEEPGIPSHTSVAAASDALDTGLVSPMFDRTAENAIGLHPSAMRRLGISVGDLCSVSSTRSSVTLVLTVTKVTSKDVPSGKATVHSDTLQLLEGRDATVAPYDGPPPAECGTPIVLHRLEMEADASDAAKRCRMDPRQLEAAFHARFRDQVVFDRMVAGVTIAAVAVRLRLELPTGVDLARLTPMTRYSVVPLKAADVVEAEDGGTTVATPATGHELHVGPSGSGKSFSLTSIVAQRSSAANAVVLRCEELVAAAPAAAVTALQAAFRRACAQPPATIVLDDAHIAFGAAAASDEALWKKRLLAHALAAAMDALPPSVVCVAAAPSADSIDNALIRAKRFRVVEHSAPSSAAERETVLRSILRSEEAHGTSVTVDEAAIREVSALCIGFVQADLASAVALAKTIAFDTSCKFDITSASLASAVRKTRPSAIRNIDVAIPTVRWDDIGGSAEGKRVLQEYVRWSLGEQRQLFAKLGVAPPRGVLLYGPPGCSKTMLAKALAHESGLNFIAVKGPEVFSKWVGDSEKAVRDIFAKARSVAPCVVFVDELDGMCGHRGAAGGGGVSDRVISQFLTELDGLPAAVAGRPDDVVFVAATNRPDNIDPAVLRPGRIDRFVYVGLPGRDERAAIAAIGFRKVPTEDGVTADAVADRTEGYTGAEVIAVCKEAAYQCIAESEDADMVCARHLEAALQRTKPRVSPDDVAWYKTWGEQTRR